MNGEVSLFLAAAAAILASAVTAGLGLAIWTLTFDTGLLMVMLAAAIVAAPHLLFLGLPLFFILGAAGPVRWWQAGIAGVLIGLPLPLYALGFHPRDAGMPAEVLPWLLWFGSSGLAGALAFRAVYGGELGGPSA